MPDFHPLVITDYVQLGKLFKTWALKEDRVLNGKTYLPQPTSVASFCVMLISSEATTLPNTEAWLASFNGELTDIEFVQTTSKRLSLRLPMKEMLENREAGFATGDAYVPPDFYSEMFFNGLPPSAPATSQKTLDAHNARVGDYCIAQCG
jgi:hypothetical protein